jgi:hypothetical protein
VYLLLAAGVTWEAVQVVAHVRRPPSLRYDHYNTVTVSGNVDRPGRYRVPDGTTHWELLRVAGVRVTSNLAALNLLEQVDDKQLVHVGSLSVPASVIVPPSSARLEYYVGTPDIVSRDGSLRPQTRGAVVLTADAVRTDSGAQAEVSVGAYTRVDIDRSSEVAFDRIGAAEGEKRLTQLTQRSGAAWYRVVYTTRNERFSVVTTSATFVAAGSGADFLVEMQGAWVRVHALEGVLVVTRPDGLEAMNLVAGQTATVWNDSRPFQVGRTSADVSVNRSFARLQQTRQEQASVDVPITFVFCTLPQAYYFVAVQFATRTVHVVRLPAETSAEPYARGFTTLTQALLLGGGPFMASLVEQIVGMRVDRHCILGKDGLIELVSTLGSVNVAVDEKAAKFMGIKPGAQALTGEQLFSFLKPRVSGMEDSRRRQEAVLHALFDAVRGRSIIINTMLADRAASTLETNFSPADIVAGYARFAAVEGWTFKTQALPGTYVTDGAQAIFQPDVDAARQLLFGG